MNDKLVEEWISKAEEDFKTIEELSGKDRAAFATTICFHAQQCAEKYLKALLTKYNLEPPWTHNLETLLDILLSYIPSLDKFRTELTKLTPFGTEYRYPGRSASSKEAESCINIVNEIRVFFTEEIKLEEDLEGEGRESSQ